MEAIGENGTVEEYIRNVSVDGVSEFNDKHQIGFSLTYNGTTAYFNGNYYHTVPIALQAISNFALGIATNNTVQVSVSNLPFKETPTQSKNSGSTTNAGGALPFNVLFALAIFCKFYMSIYT